MVSMRQRILETCLAMSLASLALTVALRTGVAARDSLDVMQGICRELLSGSTEGRQALVGSCWYGPLPIFCSTVVAWFDRLHGASLLAVVVTAWCGWTLALYRIGRLVTTSRSARIMAQLAATIGIASCEGAWNPAVALPVYLGLQAAGSCADWAATRRLGALATLGFTLGALALCGVSLIGWVAVLMVLLVIVTLLAPDVRRRLLAVLVLGWLPLCYALAIWALINWLLLGHPLYFIRSLFVVDVLSWHGWPTGGLALSRLAIVFGMAAVVLAAVRRRPDGVVLGVLGIGAWCWAHLLAGYAADAADHAAEPLALLLGVLAMVRAVVPPAPLVATDDTPTVQPAAAICAGQSGMAMTVAGVVLLALAVGAWRDVRSVTGEGRLVMARWLEARQQAVFQDVAAYVQARTPYARVFVCGYEGLGLLCNRPPDSRLTPNMDLHLPELRQMYHGQQIFVLIRRPTGRSAMDSVHGSIPGAYRGRGIERTLFARDFGDWRLFEIIVAPTEEQLRSWRNH